MGQMVDVSPDSGYPNNKQAPSHIKAKQTGSFNLSPLTHLCSVCALRQEGSDDVNEQQQPYRTMKSAHLSPICSMITSEI